MQTANEAKRFADGYEERKRKHEQKFFVRIYKYLKEKQDIRTFNKRLKDYQYEIKIAAKYGQYKIKKYLPYYNSDAYDEKVLKKLGELGYNISTCHEEFGYRGRYVIISWE